MDEYNKMWTPYVMKIILHAHTSSSLWPERNAPIYRDTINNLISSNLLVETPEGALATTARGNSLCSMWMDTPLPIQVYIDPRSGKPA